MTSALVCLLLAADHRALPRPTPAWLALQLVPALAVELAPNGATATEVRWQLTPLSWSWGTHPRATRWRTFVVEPRLRHGGSIELAVAPALRLSPSSPPALTARPTLRAFFPVLEYGEALSLSLGLSYQRLGAVNGVGLELGVSVLFGIVGVLVSTFVEEDRIGRTFVMFQLRAF